MNKTDIFSNHTYRDLIKNTLIAKKNQFKKKFTFQKLATHCRIQKTYLSKVLNGNGHLNSDQVFLAANFLQLTSEETEFLMKLHESERSVVQTRKQILNMDIQKLRKKNLTSDRHISAVKNNADETLINKYYLDANMQLVHIFLTIPKFRDDVSKIKHKLNLTQGQLETILNDLITLGYLRFDGTTYQVEQNVLHLPAESPIWHYYKTLMRIKSLEKIQTLSSESTYNFSAIFSSDSKTKELIQKKFLNFLKEAQNLAIESPKETVYQMNFDLFPWSD